MTDNLRHKYYFDSSIYVFGIEFHEPGAIQYEFFNALFMCLSEDNWHKINNYIFGKK